MVVRRERIRPARVGCARCPYAMVVASANGDDRRDDAEHQGVARRGSEVGDRRAVDDRLDGPRHELRDRQEEDDEEQQPARRGGEPAPPAAQAPRLDDIPTREVLLVPRTSAHHTLDRQEREGQPQQHGRELQRGVLVERAVPHPEDRVGERLDTEEVHGTEVGERLHDRQGDAGRERGPGQGQRDPDDRSPVAVAEDACRVQGLARLPEERAPREHVDVGIEHRGEDADRRERRVEPGDAKPVPEQVRLERAREAVLPEDDEDQHVPRHRHGEDEGPVEQPTSREVVERVQDREATADEQRAGTDTEREQHAGPEGVGQQRARDRVEPRVATEEAEWQRQQRSDDEQRDQPADHRPPRDARRGPRGRRPRARRGVGRHVGARQFQPTSSISAIASSSRGPACSTSIGSCFTSAQSANCGSGGTDGFAANSPSSMISSCAATFREELDELDRLGALVRSAHDAGTGDVRVRPGTVLVGPRGRHREVLVLEQRPREVVVVAEADVAVSGGHRGEQLAVGVEHLRIVRHPGAEQRLGGGVTALGDHVGDERLVVVAVRGAEARTSAEARITEGLVARDLTRIDPLGRDHGDAHPRAQGPPFAARIVQLGWHVRFELGRGHGREQPRVLGPPEVREVGRDQDVGRGVVALAPEPLEELGCLAAPELDVDPGRLLEVLEHLLVAVVRAAVVDDERVALAARQGDRRAADQEDEHERHDWQGPTPTDEIGEHSEFACPGDLVM